jgi:hypothetical protein
MDPLQQLMSGQIQVPPHTEQAFLSPTARLMQGLVGAAKDVVTFPRRFMEQGGTTEEAMPWARDMALNMVGAPVQTTSAATLGSGAVRRGAGGMSGQVLPPEASTVLSGISSQQRAKLGPMLEQLEKLGATPEQLRTMSPVDAYNFIKDRGTTLGSGGDKRTAGILGGVQGIRAYHGSPHDFDRFDMSKIGTGEGAQAYGHGLYFADKEAVARDYRNKLTRMKNEDLPKAGFFVGRDAVDTYGTGLSQLADKFQRMRLGNTAPVDHDQIMLAINAEIKNARAGKGPVSAQNAKQWEAAKQFVEGNPSLTYGPEGYAGRMYEVNINARPEQLLDWDKPVASQPHVVNAFRDMGYKEAPWPYSGKLMPERGKFLELEGEGRGAWESLYDYGAGRGVAGERAAAKLREAGIPGIRYLDQGSRAAGEGSSNYVMFDDSLIDILRKYMVPGAAGPLAALMAGQEQQ